MEQKFKTYDRVKYNRIIPPALLSRIQEVTGTIVACIPPEPTSYDTPSYIILCDKEFTWFGQSQKAETRIENDLTLIEE